MESSHFKKDCLDQRQLPVVRYLKKKKLLSDIVKNSGFLKLSPNFLISLMSTEIARFHFFADKKLMTAKILINFLYLFFFNHLKDSEKF